VEIREIAINKIHPNYRLLYTEDIILSLCDDIRCHGLREPIIVELVEYWFEIVDGEKRWRACKRIGLNKIKAIILETSII
jgi:ParB family chromosome partitioning protein